jgi:hypothetical protein
MAFWLQSDGIILSNQWSGPDLSGSSARLKRVLVLVLGSLF